MRYLTEKIIVRKGYDKLINKVIQLGCWSSDSADRTEQTEAQRAWQPEAGDPFAPDGLDRSD